jgi:hypothetical protein
MQERLEESREVRCGDEILKGTVTRISDAVG